MYRGMLGKGPALHHENGKYVAREKKEGVMAQFYLVTNYKLGATRDRNDVVVLCSKYMCFILFG